MHLEALWIFLFDPLYRSVFIDSKGKNFLEWSQFVKLGIDGHGKLWYLTSETKKLEEEDRMFTTWR